MLTQEQILVLRKEEVQADRGLAGVFGALSDLSRFRMFRLLLKERDLCVTDIANVMDISVPAASQQLRILETSGLVSRQRRGQMICYTVRQQEPLVKAVIKILTVS
jgi:DNA-binding transcriptional ArsR family regulator